MKSIRRILWMLTGIFICMNVVAFFHAYYLTHFTNKQIEKTSSKQLSTVEKIKTLLTGVNNPRPKNKSKPKQTFQTIKLQSNKIIECWNISVENAKGTVILFHGYSGEKSSMIERADAFIELGFSTVLVDFMGSGGSEGNQSTIGYKEAEQVKTCFDFVANNGEQRVFLYGTSMGAVAIMKSIHDYKIEPTGIMIECPFGSLYQTTAARFKALGVPAFPMAGLLVFWGGVQNGFWPFSFQPTEYAKAIYCPTLLMYGNKDAKVSRAEIDEIFTNLKGLKTLSIYLNAGHEDFLKTSHAEWSQDIQHFLGQDASIAEPLLPQH